MTTNTDRADLSLALAMIDQDWCELRFVVFRNGTIPVDELATGLLRDDGPDWLAALPSGRRRLICLVAAAALNRMGLERDRGRTRWLTAPPATGTALSGWSAGKMSARDPLAAGGYGWHWGRGSG